MPAYDCRSVTLRFSLVPPEALVDMGRSVGPAAVELLGDWAGAPYDEASSPSLIVIFERVR